MTELRDISHEMIRTAQCKVCCTQCDAHRRHVFDVGPKPRRTRLLYQFSILEYLNHFINITPTNTKYFLNNWDNPCMKFLSDLFPIVLFFIAFQFSNIYTATIVAMVSAIGQMLWVYYRHHKIDAMQWVSLVMILLFGGLTIFLHDKTFFQLKPTAFYWLFAGALYISAQFFQKNWIQTLMSKQIVLKEHSSKSVWHQVNAAWATFFFFMGTLNLYIVFEYSEKTWVNFKLFGTTGLLTIFVILQGVWLSRYIDRPTK